MCCTNPRRIATSEWTVSGLGAYEHRWEGHIVVLPGSVARTTARWGSLAVSHQQWRQLAFIRTLQPRRIGKLGVRVWSGTWPPRAVLPTCTCGARSPWKGTEIPSLSAPTQPTTVGLEPTNQNPTSVARILRMTRPATNDDRRPGEPSRPEARNDLQGTKEPPSLEDASEQLTILLIPPPCGVEGSALG